MSTKFVSVDRNQPLLLPPDLRDWIPQYPPHMMLALLIYCYANGVFSSRRHDRAFKVERATYRDIAVRFLTGDTHPDRKSTPTTQKSTPKNRSKQKTQQLAS